MLQLQFSLVSRFTCFSTMVSFSSTQIGPVSLLRVNLLSTERNLSSFLPTHLHCSLSRHRLTPTTCTSACQFSFPRHVFFCLPVLVSFTRSFTFLFSHLPPIFCLPVSLLCPFHHTGLTLLGGGVVYSTDGATCSCMFVWYGVVTVKDN